MPAKWHKYSYSAQRQERRSALSVVLFIALFAAVFWLFHSFLFTMYRVGSQTMNPGIADGDRVIATPLYRTGEHAVTAVPFFATAARGDLVVIEPAETSSQGFISSAIDSIVAFATLQRVRPFSDPRSLVSKPVIRRIVGLPGDTIYLDKSVLHIKTPDSAHFLTEFEIVEKNYDIAIDVLPEGWTSNLPFSDFSNEITLGPDEYFILCDNRQTASDSRIWGPISGSRIRAKVLFRYWPFSAIGPLH